MSNNAEKSNLLLQLDQAKNDVQLAKQQIAHQRLMIKVAIVCGTLFALMILFEILYFFPSDGLDAEHSSKLAMMIVFILVIYFAVYFGFKKRKDELTSNYQTATLRVNQLEHLIGQVETREQAAEQLKVGERERQLLECDVEKANKDLFFYQVFCDLFSSFGVTDAVRMYTSALEVQKLTEKALTQKAAQILR